MDSRHESSSKPQRHKCAACYRQFNRMEHLVEHMRVSYHSGHEPTCGVCNKHCRCFDSLREHLIGPLPKEECRSIFSVQGCQFCLTILDSPASRGLHEGACRLSTVNSGSISPFANMGTSSDHGGCYGRGPQVVAMACKMAGGGYDGSLDVCVRVCMIDEYENIIFQTYVRPRIPITNYRYETTRIRPGMLQEAMGLREVQTRIQDILCNGEPMWKIRPTNKGGKGRILVGHGLDRDLDCLQIEFPQSMIRDTEKYPPLMKTSGLSNSLNYLTQTYLGYDIQTSGTQDQCVDCVAVMRLYLRMRNQDHVKDDYPLMSDPQNRNNFAAWGQADLERMSPDQLMQISRSDYYCWCLDNN